MENALRIRQCTPADLEAWITLNREFMAFEIQGDSVWNSAETTPDEKFAGTFAEALASPEAITLYLIEKNGEPVGFANLMIIFSVWAQGKGWILDDLFIRPEHRGKGAGRQVMEQLEKEAVKRGYKRLQFMSELTNPGAHAFYTALGFQSQEMHFYIKHL